MGKIMLNVIKRNGSEVEFNPEKIRSAITRANAEVDFAHQLSDEAVQTITTDVAAKCMKMPHAAHVEEIQEMVEDALMASGSYEVAKAYIRYRYKHMLDRTKQADLMKKIGEKIQATNIENQNANIDEMSFGGRKGEADSALMKQWALDNCISKMARMNHENNEIYIHDLDSYAVGMHNCLSIPFDSLLANGFNTRQTDVRPAQSVSTAFQLLAVIFQLQSLQNFGGVSATHIDWTMVPYVRKSFYKHFADGVKYLGGIDFGKYEDSFDPAEQSIDDHFYKTFGAHVYEYAMDMTLKEVNQAVEGMYHNLNTLQSRSGNQLKVWLLCW